MHTGGRRIISVSGPDGRVSFIVPAFNAMSTLGETVASIRQAAKDFDHEIVIVNDASIDDTYNLALELGDIVMTRACQAGAARARNDAAARATGEILFFVDSDVTVTPEAVAILLNDIAEGPDAVFGAYTPLPPPDVRDSPTVFKNLLHHYTHLQGAGPATTFWSGFSVIRRDAFREVQGFDPRVTWSADVEDIHLGYRLTRAGKTILLDPRAQVMHHKRYTTRKIVISDLLHRAIPWTKTMLELRTFSVCLNLRGGSVLSSLLVYLAIAGVLALPFATAIGVTALVFAAGAWAFVNRHFLAYAHQHWKPFGALKTAAYLALMNVYAPLGAMVGVLFFLIRPPNRSIRNTMAFDEGPVSYERDVTVALVLGHALDAQALAHLPAPAPWWELLVVGHAPPPNLPSHATFLQAPPASGPNVHAQMALNEARGRMIALLNAREVPEPNWLERVQRAVHRGDLAVGGSFEHDRRSPRRRALGVLWNWRWRPEHPEMWMQDHPPTNCAYRTYEVTKMGGFVHRTSLLRRLSAYGVRPVRFDPKMKVRHATDVEPLPFGSIRRFGMMSNAVNAHFYDYRKPVRVAMILASPIHFTTHVARIVGQAVREHSADRTFVLALPSIVAGSAIYELGAILGLLRPRRYVERMLDDMRIAPEQLSSHQTRNDSYASASPPVVKQV